MISFTLTEKGYIIQDDTREFLPDYKHDRENGPEGCQSFFGKLTALCLERCRAGLSPLALVSLDNCSDNGTRLERAVRHMHAHGRETASSPRMSITSCSRRIPSRCP